MKKAFFYSLIFVFTLTISCKTGANKAEKVNFGFSETYTLDKDEKEFSLTENIVNEYELFQDFEDFNLPLNKYIKGKNHSVFIAAAVENNEAEVLKKLAEEDESIQLIDKKNDDTFTQLLVKKNDVYGLKLIYSEQKQNMPMVISLVSKDSIIVKEKYEDDALLSKIN